MTTVILNGKEIDYAAAVELMDDEIRETIHMFIYEDGNEQNFLNDYCAQHKFKYGVDFQVN